MNEKLDFSLPQKRRGAPVVGVITVVLLAALIVLAAVQLGLTISSKNGDQRVVADGVSVEQTKQLADKLAQRTLYRRAADVWKDYVASAELSGTERAKALFQVGTLLEKDGAYAEAIESYYRSEMAEEIEELRQAINAHVKDCYEKLGKFSALRYELIDRTSLEPAEAAGGRVVAEIGPEKITEADLDGFIEKAVAGQLTPLAAFMTPEQLAEQKKKLLEQYKGPQAKLQFLQGWLAQEILYRQALEDDLAEREDMKERLADMARGVLSRQLMNEQLASKINITESDLKTFYAAHKSEYIEPARAKISHIVVGEQEQAKKLIERIKGGEDFGALAKEFSLDEASKDNGGEVEGAVTKGSYVPGIGDAGQLNAAIFAGDALRLLEEPYKSEKGWEIVRVESIQAERQMSFDQVRNDVMSALLGQKRQDVQREYVDRMMDKFGVIVHTSVLMPSDGQAPQGDQK